MDRVRGLGRAVFAAVLLMVGGVLNIVYGIAAIGNSSFLSTIRSTSSPVSRVGGGSL
jgi:hypothetical protein